METLNYGKCSIIACASWDLFFDKGDAMKKAAFLILFVLWAYGVCLAQDVPTRFHGMAEISLPGHAPIYAAMTSESFGPYSWHITLTATDPYKEWQGDALVTVASCGEGRVLVVLGGYNATIILTPSEPAIKAQNNRGAGVARTAMTHVTVRNLPDGYVDVTMQESMP